VINVFDWMLKFKTLANAIDCRRIAIANPPDIFQEKIPEVFLCWRAI